MSYGANIASTLMAAGIDSADQGAQRGWDYWEPSRPTHDRPGRFDPRVAVNWATAKPDTDGTGMARLPHRHLLRNGSLPPHSLPILDADMDVRHLVGGIFRQCLIRPSEDGEPVGDNPYLLADPARLCTSSRHLMALIGHPPRDLALWLDDLRRGDVKLFRLVLAKDFKAAQAHDPDLVERPWPHSVRRLWRDGEGDVLPPLRVAVLYAELARTAMNHVGLVGLGFDGAVELTTKRLLERIGTNFGPGVTAAATRAIANVPYQTVALRPPDSILAVPNVAPVGDWARTVASRLALQVAKFEFDGTDRLNREAAQYIKGLSADHPQNMKENRKGGGASIQPRRLGHFWGIPCGTNAAVRLLEIADTAREWNRHYRPNGPGLPNAHNPKKGNPVACALVTIRFRWTAEASPAAAASLLAEMLSLKEAEKPKFVTSCIEQIDSLTIDEYIGDKSGLELQKRARQAMEKLPQPDEFGYTARSQAHLWLDDIGDDIVRYRNLQIDAVNGHEGALNATLPMTLKDVDRVPAEVVAELGRQLGVKPRRGAFVFGRPTSLAMTLEPAAAYGAQLMGQRISPLSTDPMHARLHRRTPLAGKVQSKS